MSKTGQEHICSFNRGKKLSKRNVRKNRQFRFYRSDSSAVSNIVTSIMMMGIVMTLLGMVLTVYVPIWAKSMEAQHMEGVSNSFTDLKSTIDSQITNGDLGTKISTRVTLGTEGGPLLGLGQSTGGLLFQPESSMLSVYNSNDTFEKYGTGRGRVVFNSNNVYYVDQEYVYENGAIILNQEGSTLMKVEPNFNVNTISGSNELYMVLITLQGELENVGGIKSQTMQTSLMSYNKDTIAWGTGSVPGSGKNITLAVNTSYPLVWEKYFSNMLENSSGMNVSDYEMVQPSVIGDPIDNYWLVEVIIRDVNKFTTTIAYVETSVV